MATTPARRVVSDKPRRRRWPLLAGPVLLVVLVGLAPGLLARTPLVPWALGKTLADFPGTVKIGRLSLGWFRPVVAEDVEVLDEAGRTLLAAPRVGTEKTLLALVRNTSDLGVIRVEQPTLEVVVAGNVTNLEQALAGLLRGDDDAPADGSLHGIALHLDVVEARVTVRDEDRGPTWDLDAVNLTVDVPADRRESIRLQVSGGIAATGGTLEADASLQLVEVPGGHPRTRGQGTVRVGRLPLALAALALRRFEPTARLDGTLTADLDVTWEEQAEGVPAVRGSGSLAFRDLFVAGPWLADPVRLARLDVPAQVAVAKERIRLDRAEVVCDAGKASLSGTLDLRADLARILKQPGLQASLDVDLARLAELLPRTLHLQQDLRVTAGRLRAAVASTAQPEGVLWEGNCLASGLRATRGGQGLTWDDPVDARFAVRQGPDGLPVVERLQCTSDFLRLEGSGTAERVTVAAGVNLGRLTEKAARFVDLGKARLEGQGQVLLSVQKSANERYTLRAESKVWQVVVAGPTGRAWQEADLTLEADLVGHADKNGLYHLESGKARLRAGSDALDVDLVEPWRDLPKRANGSARVRLTGDLVRWQQRAGLLIEFPREPAVAGTGTVAARVRVTPESVDVDEAQASVREAQVRGFGLALHEPTLDLQTAGRLTPATGKLDLRTTRVNCPTLAAEFAGLIVAPNAKGVPQVSGRGTIQRADAVRLQRWLLAPGSPELLHGTVSGTVDVQTANNRLGLTFDGAVQDAVVGNRNDPVWREPRLQVAVRGQLDPEADRVQLDRVRVSGAAVSAEGAGQLTRLSDARLVSLKGQLDYDLDKLEPQLRPYLGTAVKVTGRDAKTFRVEGSLNPEAPRGLMLSLTGDAGAGWQSLRALGAEVGPASLQARLQDGWIRCDPWEATLNQGKLRLSPSLRLDPGPAEVFLPKGTVIDHARLSPALCASALGYALPALANVLEAEGELSLALDGGRVPVAAPARGDLSGQLTLHRARVSPSPLLRELAAALSHSTTTLDLARDQVVPIRLANGRVYHRDLRLTFPDLVVTTSGSVGVDGSLALVAEMPVPPKWVGGRLRDAVAKQTVQLPIGGTLARPKLDERALREATARFAREAAGEVLRQEVERKLDKLLRPKK